LPHLGIQRDPTGPPPTFHVKSQTSTQAWGMYATKITTVRCLMNDQVHTDACDLLLQWLFFSATQSCTNLSLSETKAVYVCQRIGNTNQWNYFSMFHSVPWIGLNYRPMFPYQDALMTCVPPQLENRTHLFPNVPLPFLPFN
jgi:hypothetical protein